MTTITISSKEFDALIFTELVDTNCLKTVSGGYEVSNEIVRAKSKVRVPRMLQIKDVTFVENI